MKFLIVAGGSGTRLWPVSTVKKPKQLLPLIGKHTLLQNTYNRLRSWVKPADMYIATHISYLKAIQKQLPAIPRSHYSLEPVLLDRAPAIGLAASLIEHDVPGSIIATVWSDHHISDVARYRATLAAGEAYLSQHPDSVIAIGVRPTHPHTGMGYIKLGKQIANNSEIIHQVAQFAEKPDSKTAEKYVLSGKYLWNTGYFMFRSDTLLALYKQHLPDIAKKLHVIQKSLGTKKAQSAINKVYPTMPKVDIETGLMEKLKDLVVITADFSWADIGSWQVIHTVQQQKDNSVVSLGHHIDVDSTNSLVYNYNQKQLVATLGLHDISVVVTPESVLVSNKAKSEHIKQLIAKIKANPKFAKYL
jgi:mannose-1-phosphate guanylyltransferase